MVTSVIIKKRIITALKYLFLSVFSIISVFPLLWMLISATNSSPDVIRGKMTIGKHLAENYKNIIASYDLWGAMKNSFSFAMLQTLLSMAVCSLAGYGFEIFQDKRKDRLMSILLLAMMVPFASTMIPLFQFMGRLGFINTIAGFVLPSVATPFLIMLFRQSARSFPHDIIEAARIDGLSELQIFIKMFIPTMRSSYAAAMTITFMSAWNSYLWPKIILIDGKTLTMPMLIANMTSGYLTDYGMIMLAVSLTTLPTVIIFFLLQKSFKEGIAGAVK